MDGRQDNHLFRVRHFLFRGEQRDNLALQIARVPDAVNAGKGRKTIVFVLNDAGGGFAVLLLCSFRQVFFPPNSRRFQQIRHAHCVLALGQVVNESEKLAANVGAIQHRRHASGEQPQANRHDRSVHAADN